MKPRMLLVIVILLSLCACVLFAYGGMDERSFQGRFNPRAPSFDGLRRMLTTRLKTEEMRLSSGSLSCLLTSSRLSVEEEGSCVFTIHADASRTRQISLVLGEDGSTIQLKLIQPNALSIEQTLHAGEQIDLDIFRNTNGQTAELSILNCQVDKSADDPDVNRVYYCSLEIKN